MLFLRAVNIYTQNQTNRPPRIGSTSRPNQILDKRTRASDRERTVATARLAFVREIERLSGIVGKEKAVQHLVSASRLGSLSPALQELISTATACKRGGTLSRRSLYRWASDYAEGGEAALLPAFRKSEPLPDWFEAFLGYYQKPQHPTVALAYDEFARALKKRGETPPSIYAVRRALNKMSAPAREAGRALSLIHI